MRTADWRVLGPKWSSVKPPSRLRELVGGGGGAGIMGAFEDGEDVTGPLQSCMHSSVGTCTAQGLREIGSVDSPSPMGAGLIPP